ncbi:hypothetical protein GY45DRAFT_1435189 [Cubamyces sp. BRFM 1775]|nr:hypothetical protein GY45DRAFT_1435189 [Cubamyces sp. BRFM 1775]
MPAHGSDDEFGQVGRTRFIGFRIDRDPNGPFLEKDKGPIGNRTPNGLVWAHELNELFFIPRDPGIPDYVTVWSRSMLKTIGEQYDELEKTCWRTIPLVSPRIIRPWPVLKLPSDHPAQIDPPFGAVDEGCEFEHSDCILYRIRADGYYNGPPKFLSKKVPRRCPSDPSEPCTTRLIRNDTPDDTGPTLRGLPYEFFWCEHFRAKLEGKSDDEIADLVGKTIYDMSECNVIADHLGVRLFKRGRAPDSSGAASATSAPSGSASTSQPEKNPGEEDAMKVDSTQEPDKAAPSVVAEKSPPPAADLFSTKDLPKLEETIPEAFLPDILLVHDPDRTTQHASNPNEPIKYRRVIYPVPQLEASGDSGMKTDDKKGSESLTDYILPPRDSDAEERVAHLHLRQKSRLGMGNHSFVYHAPLTLPPPLSAYSPTGQVTVAAKLAFPHCSAHALLHNEARAYSAFTEDAQHEYCGYNIIPPCYYPVPVVPIVPKFYGFYLPVGDDGKFMDEFALHEKEHRNCSGGSCKVPWISPILLMEECGQPVKPHKFTMDQRTECFSLILRLHDMGITQNSFYLRNILIQPGPLSMPPSMRSFKTPSFRIIDFGRARVLTYMLAEVKEADPEKRKDAFRSVSRGLSSEMHAEEKQARDQLLLEFYQF